MYYVTRIGHINKETAPVEAKDLTFVVGIIVIQCQFLLIDFLETITVIIINSLLSIIPKE